MSDSDDESMHVLVARIDERTRHLESMIDKLTKEIESRYVSMDEFEPVKNVTFGLVGVILISVIGSIIALVMKH